MQQKIYLVLLSNGLRDSDFSNFYTREEAEQFAEHMINKNHFSTYTIICFDRSAIIKSK